MSCEFRSVCSVRSPKEQNKGELTLFHACTRTPAPGKDKCETHLREDVCKEDDSVRKDLGPMTRARAKALGVEEELAVLVGRLLGVGEECWFLPMIGT